MRVSSTQMDHLLPFPSFNALHLFVCAPLQRRACFAVPQATGAARSGMGHRVLYLCTSSRPPVISKMSNSCYGRVKFLPSGRNYEGYIPRTCSTSSSHVSPLSSPMALPISSGFVVSANLTSDVPQQSEVVSTNLNSDVRQRSEDWFSLRREKLTTSTFSTVLGFWKGNRRSELWHQKVFAQEEKTMDTAAKAAMDWGVLNEPTAIEQYKSLTGRDVSFLGFASHMDASNSWLGASPDGLLGCHPDGGILEVKCPYNKGKPELAFPWKIVPHYYMPQVQGQMEVMDRDWVDLYCWTINGSSLFRVLRDRAYWELIHRVLHEFWWGNVVPARQALLMGSEAEAKAYEPKAKHQMTGLVISRSRKLAAEAKLLCQDNAGNVEFFT